MTRPFKDDTPGGPGGEPYPPYETGYPGDATGAHIADNSDGDNSFDPDSGVKRGLKNRHLSMLALAGIIGPGLLVGSGGALNSGGPASLIIGFGVIGKFRSLPVKRCTRFIRQLAATPAPTSGR